MHPIDIILKRRSIRRFKKQQVPWDNIVSMIQCAMNAPVAGNVFATKFIVVREPANIKDVADACYNQAWITTAPCLIALAAEPEHQKRYYGSRGERLYTIQNNAACAMSLIIAAESLGLGSCWVGAFDEDKIRNVFGLPEHANIYAIIAIGYPDEQPKSPPKPYIKTCVYHEKWWMGRKFPAFGYYSDNVMKATKSAGDAINKVAEQIIGKGKEKK
jgi:nitroreductase